MYGKMSMSSKAGKAIATFPKKPNWTESPGGQAAGLVNPGKAKMRRTMRNRGQGTGLADRGSSRVRVPKTRHGYFPLHGESYG